MCCEKAPKQRRQETLDQSTQDSVSGYSTCPATQTSAYGSEEAMY